MDFRFTSQHLTEALARATQHWQTHADDHPAAAAPPRFSIAISREAGTYGAAVARLVAERLGWQIYDRELLTRIANDMGVRQQLVDSVDERQNSWTAECLAAVFAVPTVSQTAYFRALVETLTSLAAHGDCVIVGRGASHILPAAATLRVRIMAPRDHRVEMVRRERGTTVVEAGACVDQTDQDRNDFIRSHFRVDAADASHYDLILNAARLSKETCADLIIAALHDFRNQAAKTPEAALHTA